jgi:uncharacterized membrane protein
MSYNTFKLIRLVIIIILAALVTWAAYQGNAWVPIPAVIAAIVIMLLFRRGVKETIIDERVYSVAYHASRLAFILFAVGAVTVGATLLALGQSGTPELKPAGFTLCYAVCGLVIIYNIAYIFYNRKFGGKNE